MFWLEAKLVVCCGQKWGKINNLMKWERRWWHKYIKQACVLRYKNRNRRLKVSLSSLCAGAATGLLQTQRRQLKKQAEMTEH